MKKIILLLLVSLSLSYSHAQTNKRDSLKQLLQEAESDTSRVLLLVELCFQYQYFKPDSAVFLAIKALELSRRIGFAKGEALSLMRIGNASGALGNYPKAMGVYLEALKIREKINDVDGIANTFNNDGIANTFNNIGNIYRLQGEYRQAVEYFFKTKRLSEHIIQKDILARTLGDLSLCYLALKQYDSAKVYIHQAYEISSKLHYPFTTGNLLSITGAIYSETGQKKLALEYYHRSIPYKKLIQNDLGLSETFLGMAKLFENEGQMDSTLFYASQALKIAQEKKFAKQFLDAGSFLSSFYKNRRNVDSAFFIWRLLKQQMILCSARKKQNNFKALPLMSN